MNENTFLDLGNNNQASQPMGMDPMGGDASSMSMSDPNDMGGDPNAMGGDPNAMGGDPNAMGGDPNDMGGDANTPVMGANPFGDGGGAEVSGDPEKKAESLAGQLASIFRNDLRSDGINTHEDKKKEVLGMIASAIVDGMNEEDRNSMIEYLSDKLNGSGESDGDENDDNGMEQDMGDDEQYTSTQNDMNGNQGMMEEPNEMGGNPTSQEITEHKVNEIVNKIIREFTGNDLTKKKTVQKTKVDQEEKKGYKSNPYTVKK